jgi:CHASE3 domain sensor protein
MAHSAKLLNRATEFLDTANEAVAAIEETIEECDSAKLLNRATEFLDTAEEAMVAIDNTIKELQELMPNE